MSTAQGRRPHTPKFELDPRLRTPVYLQVAGQIQRHADTGRLRAGSQLPTVRQLARSLGVNFNTVARAYRLLVQGGRLSTQPGRGTFVLARLSPRRPSNGQLHALAKDFVARGRDLQFSDQQLRQAVQRVLRRQPSVPSPGDNHE
jgi:DNA-binding transcriptional regulator YhcF (GntR family)